MNTTQQKYQPLKIILITLSVIGLTLGVYFSFFHVYYTDELDNKYYAYLGMKQDLWSGCLPYRQPTAWKDVDDDWYCYNMDDFWEHGYSDGIKEYQLTDAEIEAEKNLEVVTRLPHDDLYSTIEIGLIPHPDKFHQVQCDRGIEDVYWMLLDECYRRNK